MLFFVYPSVLVGLLAPLYTACILLCTLLLRLSIYFSLPIKKKGGLCVLSENIFSI